MASGILAELKSKGIKFSHKACKRLGFHGTSKAASKLILTTGFDFAFARPNCWLGSGIYFFDNAPYAGSKFALCYATHTVGIVDPVVIEADLYFKLLLDLNDKGNDTQFWNLLKLLQKQPEIYDEVDENFVAFYIGTQIAKAMDSDGVAWKFNLSEPSERRPRKQKKQHGIAAKKLGVINRVAYCGVDKIKGLD
jgi:hypothetical protein